MDISIRIKIGYRIKGFRHKLGYTQEKLADLAGVDYKYLQRIEGKTPPAIRVDTIEKLAKALKTNPHLLLKFE